MSYFGKPDYAHGADMEYARQKRAEKPFVLDHTDNPHPVMLDKALHLRRTARATPDGMMGVAWLYYRECMIDATGETPEAIEAWLDSHDNVDVAAIVAEHHPQVQIRGRR